MYLSRSKPLLVAALSLLALGAVAGESHGPYREVSSADPKWRPKDAHLTLGTALHIAEAEAERNHVHFADFQSPWFWYQCRPAEDCVWVFHYEGTVPAEGNDFMVVVNDRTRHSEYTHGY